VSHPRSRRRVHIHPDYYQTEAGSHAEWIIAERQRRFHSKLTVAGFRRCQDGKMKPH